MREIIKPHLAQGGTVVSDRYYHSSLAYQGYGHGLDLDALGHVTRFATADLTPDLILLLDLPVQDGLIRRREEGDWNRLDAYEVQFHQRVRKGYLSMAADDPTRWLIVDAAAPMDEIQAELQSLVFHRLSNAKRKDQ